MRPRKTYNLRFLNHIIKKESPVDSITLTCNFNIFPLKQLYFVFSLFFVRYNAELS